MLDLKLIRTVNSIVTDIYQKSTHTDQYLQRTSDHLVQQKLGIIQTLMYWEDTLNTDEGRRAKRERED